MKLNVKNPTRREMLSVLGASAASLALAACARPSPTMEQKRVLQNSLMPLPQEKDITSRFSWLGYKSDEAKQAFEQMSGYEGRFYAGPSKYVNGGSIGFVKGGWGQLLEFNGRYVISTIPHVVHNAGYLNELTMHVPHVGFINVQDPFWYITKSDGVTKNAPDDSHYYFPLNHDISKYINSARRKSLLEPVTPAMSLPESDEVIGLLIAEEPDFYASDDQGFIDYFTQQYYAGDQNRIYVTSKEGGSSNCNYSSGESAFKLVQRDGKYMLNGEVYGTLTGAPYYFWETPEACGDRAVIKPFYNFDWAGNIKY